MDDLEEAISVVKEDADVTSEYHRERERERRVHRLTQLISSPLATTRSSEGIEIADPSHLPSPDNMIEIPMELDSANVSASSSTSRASSTRSLPDGSGDHNQLVDPILHSSSFESRQNETGLHSEQALMRFSQPENWLQGLTTLMDEIITTSALEHSINHSSWLLSVSNEQLPKAPEAQGVVGADTRMHALDQEWHILQTIMKGVSTNLERLLNAKYCADSINLIIQDPSRPLVARLVRLSIDSISTLIQQIQNTLPIDPAAVETFCTTFLGELGLVSAQTLNIAAVSSIPSTSASSGSSATVLARLVVQVIDLAIISYSGAHIEPFLSRFRQYNAHTWLSIAPRIHLKRRIMKCLDAYLGSPVWVFEVGERLEEDSEIPSLYLSTTIEEFASVWGPAWPVLNPSNPEPLLRYNIGIGFMVHWPRADDEPELAEGEVFCHWTTSTADLKSGSAIPRNKGRLLIGGRLSLNDTCATDGAAFTRDMRDRNRLRPLGTHWSSLFVDTRNISVQIGGGALGPAIGAGETYKIRNQSYRDQLVAAIGNDWMEACVAALMNKFVVEISSCTGLARRRSLMYALGYDGMEEYLRNHVDLDWKNEEWREDYFQMLRDHNVSALKGAMKEVDRGPVFRKALKISMLNVLLETGVDSSKMLLALWISGEAEIPWTVAFPHSEYSWTGLLSDGILGFNAAIVNTVCIELIGKGCSIIQCAQRSTNQNRYTLLETRLVLNSDFSILPLGLVRRNTTDTGSYRWSVRKVKSGATLYLGPQGNLRVLTLLKHDTRKCESGLVMEWHDSMPSRVRDFSGFMRQHAGFLPERPCHREFLIPLRGDTTQPLLIHVVSHPNLVGSQ